ncbi:MAG TPA: hypothetical protein VG167_16575 [Verrucomicrobiae bacterium]|nr:hypothetical protein [Verrucomicrobiae bacterium]
MKRRFTRIIVTMAGIVCLLAGATVVLWLHTFRHYPPKEVMRDVRAGLAARHVRDPNQRIEVFLQARYGPLTEATNRERAFLDFFDVNHIKGLNFIVSHTPAPQKAANTQAMADWLAHYRQTISVQEKEDLRARLNSDAGRAMLRQATAQYQSQDVYYRAAQQAVIRELMTTLAALRNP